MKPESEPRVVHTFNAGGANYRIIKCNDTYSWEKQGHNLMGETVWGIAEGPLKQTNSDFQLSILYSLLADL